MVILSENDYLDVKLNSLIADYDKETLANLYQPIIGYASLAVYMTLVTEAKNQAITSVISHNQLLNRLQMSPGDFINARKKLEGVGLLKTYLEEAGGSKIYHYQIYSPKTPGKFFDDTLLFGMLIKALGDTDANRFKMIYHFSNKEEGGKDISSSFIDAYQPDFDDPAFMEALKGSDAIGRRNGKINSEFNYDLFFSRLSEISQIQDSAFTKKDMKEIERLATLNGIGPEEAANAVAEIYNPYLGKGKHVDFDKLAEIFQEHSDYSYLLRRSLNQGRNYNSGETELAGKINIMETRSPKEFLAILQNGSQPAYGDLKIVNDLSKKFKLNNPVINVIIDYVLTKNDNILSRPLCEKVGASLAREGITTAVDAMNYIKTVAKKKKTRTTNGNGYTATKAEKETKNKPAEEDNISWDELIDEIEGNDGGENGKA